ncbi:hypothetical protein P43SY_002701 [Pythium insidiosum]|uniref:FYVE-type domain-containing protein n=1 Tax=Pythium insidiosum TaxID=114742 RepID=A0AAD5LRK7_PYTIN|nr:hypothetical protein P43SY_002701 [Pythium insidiosum]
MRDLRSRRDERNEDAARQPLSAAMAAAAAAGPQGSYVMSFDMPPQEVTAAAALARSQLPTLMAECGRLNASWRRVRGKKGSRVKLWEKESDALSGAVAAATAPDERGRSGTGGSRLTLRRKSFPAVRTSSFRSRASTAHDDCLGGALFDVSSASYAVRSSVTVPAPLEVVLQAIDCSIATAYRSLTKVLYESLVSDTSVLFHTPIGASAAESLAVRWLACKCSAPLVSDCDFCLLEYTKRQSIDELAATGAAAAWSNQEDAARAASSVDGLRHRDVQPAAFKVLRSMETKFCPELRDSHHHLVRSRVPLGGFLLYRTESSETTDVVFFMSVIHTARGGSWRSHQFLSSDDRQFRAIQQVLQQLALGIGRLINAVDAYRMSLQMEALRTTRWIENSDRAECVVCYRRFHPLTRRRHHCRLCGDVICRDCSIHKDADLPTIGPTTLRICKLCNVQHFGRSSPLASIAVELKQHQQTPQHAHEERSAALGQRRQSLTTPSSSSNNSSEDRSQTVAASRPPSFVDTRRRSLEQQAVSCPKAGILSGAPRFPGTHADSTGAGASHVLASPMRSPSRRWSKVLPVAARAAAAEGSPSPSSPFSRAPPARFASPAAPSSCSKAAQQSPINKFSMSMRDPRAMGSPQPARHRQFFGDSNPNSPVRPSRRLTVPEAQQRQRAGSGAGAGSGSGDNQIDDNESGTRRFAARTSPQRKLKLGRVEPFEDLLLALCQQATRATDSAFAAVSVFLSDSEMQHLVAPRDARKLLRVAPNMKCCEPVLQSLRPVATRDAHGLVVDGCELSTLPIVRGPQQTRFYAGVPLVDSTRRLLGAVAVFDARFLSSEKDVESRLAWLQVLAADAMSKIEARHTDTALKSFMDSPLVRQSEPSLASRARAESASGASYDLEVDDEQWGVTVAPMPLPAAGAGHAASPHENAEYYKRQMYRLVQQAHETQGQVLHTAAAMKLQGVSI